jgi:hypothetical protein
VLEPVPDLTPSTPPREGQRDSLFGRLFGLRGRAPVPEAPAGEAPPAAAEDASAVPLPEAEAPAPPPTAPLEPPAPPEPPVVAAPTSAAPVSHSAALEPEPAPRGYRVREELGERVASGFQDLSRLLGTIKETLQGRDGQVQQTLQALPGFLQQVPRIQRAEIECLAQISKQLEHMGTGTRDVIARLDAVPDLMRSIMVGQAEQAKFLEDLQARMAGALEVQSQAIREGLERSRRQAETQLALVQSLATTQQDIFATFQNTQNRALNVFHRAQQQTQAQHKETQHVLSRQVELLVERVHGAQTRVFWLSIGFATLAAAGLVAALLLG